MVKFQVRSNLRFRISDVNSLVVFYNKMQSHLVLEPPGNHQVDQCFEGVGILKHVPISRKCSNKSFISMVNSEKFKQILK